MTLAWATEVATWRYPPPYDLNDMTGADPAFLASPESGFWALTGDGGLLGFRSFGPDGRVPGYDYDESALDTGGGMRNPEVSDTNPHTCKAEKVRRQGRHPICCRAIRAAELGTELSRWDDFRRCPCFHHGSVLNKAVRIAFSHTPSD